MEIGRHRERWAQEQKGGPQGRHELQGQGNKVELGRPFSLWTNAMAEVYVRIVLYLRPFWCRWATNKDTVLGVAGSALWCSNVECVNSLKVSQCY